MMRKLLLSFILFFVLSNLRAQNLRVDPDFSVGVGFDSDVLQVTVLPNGKMLVIGNFWNYNGTAIKRILRLNADGTVDPSFKTGTGFEGGVRALKLLPDGKMLVGGLMTQYNGTNISGLVRLDAEGKLDNTFSTGTGFTGIVSVIGLQPDGKILVGGTVTKFNGGDIGGMVRLNANGSKDATFNVGSGFNTNSDLSCIYLQEDGKIVVGGTFTSFKGSPVNRLIRLNADGSADNSFNTGTGLDDTPQVIIRQSDGKFIVGGRFNKFNDKTHSKTVRLNVNGSEDETWLAPTFNGDVQSMLVLNDGKILVGGRFWFIGPTNIRRNQLARLNSDGSHDADFTTGTGFRENDNTTAHVYSLNQLSDGNLIAAGVFPSFNGTTVSKGLTRLILKERPSLSTTTISDLTGTSAKTGGDITKDGGEEVTARGVCWSTSTSPLITHNKTEDGTGTGSFSSSITGLDPDKKYYVRAYATNKVGTSYGNELSFTTPAPNAAPTGISLSVTSIAENSPANSIVGTLSTTDRSGDMHTYSLVSGTGDQDNASFTIAGSDLKIVNSPDYETKTTYSIRIRSTDQGELWFEKVFTVSVTDVFDDIQFSSTPPESVIAGEKYTYSIKVADPNGKPLTLSTSTLPSWLTLKAGGDLEVSTFAGSATQGSADGTGASAQFRNPGGVTFDAAGNLYVAEIGGHVIRKITPSAEVSTIAVSGSQDDNNGRGEDGELGVLYAVAVDGSGNIYVPVYDRQLIRKITPSGEITTIAGSGLVGFADGPAAQAKFNYPAGIAVDASGNVYVSDRLNHRIRKITPAGTVSTLAGSGTEGFADGAGQNAKFNYPMGITIDASGNLYVADEGNNRIRKVTPAGVVSTIAGSGGGYADGTVAEAKFYMPRGAAIDALGNVYVADLGNSRIRKISIDGMVSTVAGSTYGFDDGEASAAKFGSPNGVAVDAGGNVFVADMNNNRIRKISSLISLSGTPELSDMGMHNITIEASNGVQTKKQSFTITVKGEATLSNFEALSKNYGDASFDLTDPASTNPDGAFTYTSSDATIASINGKKVTILKPGKVTITVKQAASGSYLEASTTADLTIAPKNVTLSLKGEPAVSKMYDGGKAAALAAANYELKDLVGTDEVTVSGTAEYDNKDAGSGKTVTVNDLVLAGKDKDKYKLTTESATVEAEIKPKALTASADAVKKVYDGTDAANVTFKAFTETDGLIGQDEVSVSYTSAAYDSKHVGTEKAITFTGLGLTGADKANYSFNTFTTKGAIELRRVSVEADASSKTYGDDDPEFTYTITSGSLAEGDSFTGTLTRDAGEPVSNPVYPYAIRQGTLALSSDYELIFRRNVFNITKKVLTVKADDKEKYQGTANPALTVSYTGFAQGESKADLLTEATASTAVELNTPKGSYDIIASGASSNNYSFDYVKGVFEVKPGHPTSISLAASTVYENQAAGTLAGTLSSTSDDPSATFTYTLVDGFGDKDLFEIVGQGTRLTTKESLNFENKSSYSIKVRSTTQHGLWLEKEFTINIVNVNEQPTLANIAPETICYTTAPQLVGISEISAGPDANQSTDVSVSSSNNSLFEVLEVNQAVNGQAELRYVVSKGASGSAVVNVLVTDDGGTANGGVNSILKSFTITVNPLPVVTISADKGNSISKGDELNLTATGGVSYQWSNAEGIISGQNTATLRVRPSVTTTYRVTATNATNCSEVQEFTVTVNEDYQMVNGTNLVTPNGDNVNDYFVIRNLDMYPNHEVKIFDRAGRLLYSKKNYDDSWNGTFNGTPLAEDTYYYIVDFGSKKPVLKGFITIVRE